MPTRHLLDQADSATDTDSSAKSETDEDGKRSPPSSDADASSSGSSDDEAAIRSRQPRRQSWLLPVLLTLGIIAAAALAYFFYSRSLSIASPSPATGDESGAASGGSAGSTADAQGDTSAQDGAGTSTSASVNSTRRPIDSESHDSTGGVSTPRPTRSGVPSQTASAARPTETKPGSATSPSAAKKGAGYNKADYTLKLKLAWAYNWASNPGGDLASGVMYIPQLWGAKSVSTWKTEAEAAIKAGATHVLGFNEPDLAEQANLSPSQAADLWRSEIEQFAGKVKLVSPAVSNGVKTADGKNMGVPWLLEFIAACDGCTIDAFALHWYEKTSNTAYFTSYLSNASAELKKPIWLTEFMGTGTPQDQKKFLEFAVPWLEDQPFIERYAAFGDFADNPIANFVKGDGGLTELGETYAAF